VWDVITHKSIGGSMKERQLKAVLVVVVVVALAGFAVTAQSFPVTVIDDRGQEITIDSQPNRIIIAGTPLYAEIVIDLGAVDKLVAISESPDNPQQVASLPKVGPNYSPNIEMIISFNPDLVIGPTDWGGERGRLESAGIKVLSTPFIKAIPDIFSTIRTVGTALGLSDQANALIGQIAEEIVEIEKNTLAQEKVKAAFMYASMSDAPPYACGSETIEADLMMRSGGENVFYDIQGAKQVSFEEIVSRDPQVIFTAPSQIENLLSNALLKGVSAVKNGRVYGINSAWVTSTEVARVIRQMAGFFRSEN
jgi:iron complex transport system substrate-binding protein